MKLKYLCILSLLLITGCTSTYKHSELHSANSKLDSRKGVLISIPKDGLYGDAVYENSGRMTADAIKSAFFKHAKEATLVDNCNGDKCLKNIDKNKYGYYVMPEILHWEDRATEWSGKSDRIEIQIDVYDAKTAKKIASSSYTGVSKWFTFGGDHPQDLLIEPTDEYVNKLYR